MALLHVFGTTLVEQDELDEKLRTAGDAIRTFGAQVTNARVPDQVEEDVAIEFRDGTVTAREFLAGPQLNATTPLNPVGVGRPASIILRHLYTGGFPKGSVFGSVRKDMLVTSAVRDTFATFNMAPRAINYTKRHITVQSHIKGPAATEDGTPLVYYSPAVTAMSTNATFEMSFDDFPAELVGKIGNAITSAGGIPVFGPYSGVLIGVGAAIKLVSSLASDLVDSRPEFTETERLEFEVPGSVVPTAGFKVVCSDPSEFREYEFMMDAGLVHKVSGKVYSGNQPYVVFLLDGTEQPTLAGFTPTAASAALLSRFLSQKEGSEVIIDALVESVKLYNDTRFRNEADRLQREIDKLPGNSELRLQMEKRREAFVANIISDLLKPARA